MIKLNIETLSALDEALERITEYLNVFDIDGEVVFDSKLVSCELITNVLKHSRAVAKLKVEVGDNTVKIQVENPTNFVPDFSSHCPDATCESGRGLFLVNSLSEKVEATEEFICAILKI